MSDQDLILDMAHVLGESTVLSFDWHRLVMFLPSDKWALLPNIEQISARGCQLVSLANLPYKEQLKTLILDDNTLVGWDLTALRDCASLEKLSLAGNNIHWRDLALLVNLPRLEELNLCGTDAEGSEAELRQAFGYFRPDVKLIFNADIYEDDPVSSGSSRSVSLGSADTPDFSDILREAHNVVLYESSSSGYEPTADGSSMDDSESGDSNTDEDIELITIDDEIEVITID